MYQHPGTDPQAGVAELTLGFDYNAGQMQWLLLAPGLINWVTQDAHLGLYRNYVEMDIDDTFTPDDAWDTTNHTIDYTDADALRMQPADVAYAAEWSQANGFRMDQLFNYGSSAAAQRRPGVRRQHERLGHGGSRPADAAFQATDPATGKPYADDFGWISHTYDTPYLDVGCATQNYIEAELNENTSSIAAAPGRHAGHGRPRAGREQRHVTRARVRGPAGVRARQPLGLRRPGPGQPGHRRPARPGRRRRPTHRRDPGRRAPTSTR